MDEGTKGILLGECSSLIRATFNKSLSKEQLRELKKPLGKDASARLFCTACGMLSYLKPEESLLILLKVDPNALSDANFERDYIEGDACLLCDSEKINFTIKKV